MTDIKDILKQFKGRTGEGFEEYLHSIAFQIGQRERYLMREFFELGYDCRDNNRDEEANFKFHYENYRRDQSATSTDNSVNA